MNKQQLLKWVKDLGVESFSVASDVIQQYSLLPENKKTEGYLLGIIFQQLSKRVEKINLKDITSNVSSSKTANIPFSVVNVAYAVLGLKGNETNAMIEKAYKMKAKFYHPDVAGNRGSEEHFKEMMEIINWAKECVLKYKRYSKREV